LRSGKTWRSPPTVALYIAKLSRRRSGKLPYMILEVAAQRPQATGVTG
jgi:hypothetical protein